jgi:hypothetical protein
MDKQDLDSIFNLELARELLLAENPLITDEEVDSIWAKCNNNPWDAPVLYKILRIAKNG